MNEWISVEEKMPLIIQNLIESCDVLTFCVSHGNPSEFGHVNTYREGETYQAIDRLVKWRDKETPSFRCDRFYGKVTHWMPLPESPKDLLI